MSFALALVLTACQPAPAPAELGPAPEVLLPPPTLRRLTQAQYTQVIEDLLGEGLALPGLEPDTEEAGLQSVGAGTSSLSALGVERYETAALSLAQQVVEDPERLARVLGCTPAAPDDALCADSFVRGFGRLAWRRPLTDSEAERLVALLTDIGAAEGDFAQGAVYALTALLQSPHFLYRREHGAPSPDDPSVRLLTEHELATRLSFTLWNTTPDAELLDAADAGLLRTDEGLAAQAERLLADDRARQGVRALFTEVLHLYALDDLSKDPTVFTHASADLGPDAREETLRVIEDHLFDRNDPLRALLTTRRTFLNPRLAALYAVPAPDPEGFAATTLAADSPRRGLLGHASLLALHAHATRSSATLRGQFIRSTLLCQTIPPPPADVDTSIPEADASAPTLRDRIQSHLEDPACASCHQITDPIGLGLENFDGLGRWRDTENDAVIDASGTLDGVDFAGPRGLFETLRDHDELAPCLTTHLYQYAVGHTMVEGEEALRDWLAEALAFSGGSFLDLLYTTVMSPGFRRAGEPD